jgi:hypothetical protein
MTRHARVVIGAHAVLLVLLIVSAPARAQYEVEQEKTVWLRAVVDLRVARGAQVPSWTESGPGKTRYGGEAADFGFERVTRYELSQLVIELGAALPWGMRGQAQLNVQPDLSDDDEPWLVEAFVRKEWGADESGWGLQTGLMNIPFSLEHIGPAWAPEYSISASALDSWLWEEISLAGFEGEWWHVTTSGLRIGAIVGAGFGPDQLGRLVSLRGWTMGDGLSGVNADLPLPTGVRTEIFDERDDRPAAYTWLSLADSQELATVRVGYFDNFGDQTAAGVWDTRFATIGATLHPHSHFDVIAQYLRGEAHVWSSSNDSSLRAYYGLVSYHHRRHRATVRYDSFRINDLDGGNPTQEKGQAWTVAYFLQMGLRHRVGAEYIWLDSRRPGSAVPEPSQDSWQLSYRFRY